MQTEIIVKFALADGAVPGKLADAELHFEGGLLDGLKLIGFGVWTRRNGSGRNVTFPARSYSVRGERRSFAVLRPVVDAAAQDRLRDFILDQFEAYEMARAADAALWTSVPIQEASAR